jgi:hypothetical protein
MLVVMSGTRISRILHLKRVLQVVDGRKALFKVLNLLITKCMYDKHVSGGIVSAALCLNTEFSFVQEHDVIKRECLLPLSPRGGCSSKHAVAGRETLFSQVYWWMGLGVAPYRTESESAWLGEVGHWSSQPGGGSTFRRPQTPACGVRSN